MPVRIGFDPAWQAGQGALPLVHQQDQKWLREDACMALHFHRFE
jgi:hypothetical protein